MGRGALENGGRLLVVLGAVALAGCGKAKPPAATGTGGAAGTAAGAGAGGAGSTGAAGTGSGGAGAPATGSGGTGTPGTGAGGTGAGAGGAGAGRGGASGAAGTTGTGGAAGSGGVGAAGGSGAGGPGGAGAGGAGGSGGTAGTAGAGGSAGAIGCTITSAYSPSVAIPTVAIVTFTTDLPGITGAQIRFGLASTGPTMTAPVDLTDPGYRTVLLGMKASRNYVYRIVLTSGAGTCTSQDFPILTGALPIAARALTMTIMNPAAHARGFIVGVYRGTTQAFIFDSDGDPVWWATARGLLSRAHMSWDGKDMYVVAENAAGSLNGGNVSRISMDHTNVENNLSGLGAAHHDLTAIPGGIATMVWNRTGIDAPNAIVERSKDGTLTTVVADLATVYNSTTFHPNSIHYYPSDDSYTIGDTNPSLYVKITRQGQLVWQLGGSNPKDPSKFFQVEPTWLHNHGHQLLADGTFLLFNSNNGVAESALVLKLDPASMTASRVLSYVPTNGVISHALGDMQRLPNGNILVTYSFSNEFHEITPSGELVAILRAERSAAVGLGYAEFRETLYGPPPY